jgi:hypothetical protein
VSPVRYELGFYIPEDDILHSRRLENLKSYILMTFWKEDGKLMYVFGNLSLGVHDTSVLGPNSKYDSAEHGNDHYI